MTSLNELRKQIARERVKQKKVRLARIKVEEKARLKKQLFNLKHGSKIRVAKNIGKRLKSAGSNLATGVGDLGKGFQQQRKSKTGIGGWLQNIADNQ